MSNIIDAWALINCAKGLSGEDVENSVILHAMREPSLPAVMSIFGCLLALEWHNSKTHNENEPRTISEDERRLKVFDYMLSTGVATFDDSKLLRDAVLHASSSGF